jgi:hypothetical protein
MSPRRKAVTCHRTPNLGGRGARKMRVARAQPATPGAGVLPKWMQTEVCAMRVGLFPMRLIDARYFPPGWEARLYG